MRLELDSDEVKRVILDWAEKQWGPGTFNEVTFESGYNHIKQANLFREEPLPPTPLKAA